MAAAEEADMGGGISVSQLRPYKDLVRFKLLPLRGQLESKRLELERSKEQFETVLHTAQRMSTAGSATDPVAVEIPCDVGSGYRMVGNATDLSVIAVNIGCGIIVDLTPDEAIAAVRLRLGRISEQLQIANSEIQKVEGDIHSAQDALTQLDSLVQASLAGTAAADELAQGTHTTLRAPRTS